MNYQLTISQISTKEQHRKQQQRTQLNNKENKEQHNYTKTETRTTHTTICQSEARLTTSIQRSLALLLCSSDDTRRPPRLKFLSQELGTPHTLALTRTFKPRGHSWLAAHSGNTLALRPNTTKFLLIGGNLELRMEITYKRVR